MKTIRVNIPKGGYNIYIENGILEKSGEIIRTTFNQGKTAIITNQKIWSLYGECLSRSLKQNEIEPHVIFVPDGEQAKQLSSLEQVYDEFVKIGLLRTDFIIAFGGGVIGDLSGFAAATYMRGTKYIQIPTTLLAQVDSSVGGKTAINLKQGKNMVGAFWQPEMVISDPILLDTLSDREFSGGMAEIIKYAAIYSEDFFKKLSGYSGRKAVAEEMENIIAECCNIKGKIVEIDEFDLGERMKLNFGHTFGHAIEKLGQYEEFSHGEAVAIGMVIASKVGAMLGVSTPDCEKTLIEILKRYGLPVSSAYSMTDILPAMSLDKKNTGNKVRLILLNKIGKSIIYETDYEKLESLMERGNVEWKKV